MEPEARARVADALTDFAQLIDDLGAPAVVALCARTLEELAERSAPLTQRVSVAACLVMVRDELDHAPWPQVAALAGCTVPEARMALEAARDQIDAGAL